MDFQIDDKEGKLLGYVVNTENEPKAVALVRQHTGLEEQDYSVKEIESLNIPGMFTSCIMDQATVDNFKDKTHHA